MLPVLRKESAAGDTLPPAELLTCLQSSAAQADRMRTASEGAICPLIWIVDSRASWNCLKRGETVS